MVINFEMKESKNEFSLQKKTVMKKINLFTFCYSVILFSLFYLSPCLLMCQVDSLFLNEVKSLKNELSQINLSQQNQRNFLTVKLSSVDSKLESTVAKSDNLAQSLKTKDSIETELKFLHIKERYAYGLKALDEMEKGVVLITFMQEVLQLQQEVSNIASLWSDDDIRNMFDKVTDVSNVAGPLVSGILLLTENDETKAEKITIGSGISLSGLGLLIKKLFGNETAKKYEFIDMSRKAYDDLTILNAKLSQFIRDNSTLEKRISDFKAVYKNEQLKLNKDSINYEKTNDNIMQTLGYMDEYQIVLSQIPQYIYELKGILLTYSFHEYKENDKLVQTINLTKDKANKVENKYLTKVKPLLELTPELKKSLYGFQ